VRQQITELANAEQFMGDTVKVSDVLALLDAQDTELQDLEKTWQNLGTKGVENQPDLNIIKEILGTETNP